MIRLRSTGSCVEGTLQGDHALWATEWLKREGYAENWEVRVANEKLLMLDYDERVFDATLPEQFYTTLAILEQSIGQTQFFTVHESKGGNTHALVHLTVPMDVYERIAWQAAFGSDPKREVLHLLSVSRNELNPILLYMRKEQKQSPSKNKPGIDCPSKITH